MRSLILGRIFDLFHALLAATQDLEVKKARKQGYECDETLEDELSHYFKSPNTCHVELGEESAGEAHGGTLTRVEK